MRAVLALPVALALIGWGSGCVMHGDHAATHDDARLGGRVTPTFEAVELTIDPDRPDYEGSVRIELDVREPVESFRFHADEMTFERAELRGSEGTLDLEIEVEPAAEGMVRAIAGKPLTPGAYTLEIDFKNEYDTRAVGLYRMEQGDRGYLFTQFEATDARKAFPCWDEPSFKIPFQLTLRVPAGQEAVSNTPVESDETADGWRTLAFRKTKPLPTYLLAIAAGPLDSLEIKGLSVPGRIYTVKGQSHLARTAAEVTPAILAEAERYFGRPYPYAKLDLIAVPEFWPGAMENAGAVTFADQILLFDPDAASVSQRRTLVAVTAHELAHMWFGDLVTMAWWDDLWLNESFASWMADKITDRLYPEYGVEISSVRGVQRIMASDARPSTKPIRKPVRSTADIMEGLGLAYGKGQTVLGMIEEWIGEEPFRKGVVDYIESHAWGNATAQDLWSSLSKASGKDIGKSLSTFLDQSGYPMISVGIESDGALRIRQGRFLNHGVEAPDLQWALPIGLKYSDGEKVRTRTVLLDAESMRIDVGGPVAWVMPNAGAYGYYRWKVPDETMLLLAREAEQTMTPRERVAFLGNAGALLDAGVIGGDEFLEVLGSFADDPEPEVVSALLSGLDKVRRSFVPDELGGDFAVYVRKTLRPALERFGLRKTEGEAEAVSIFRPRLIGWLGEEGRDEAVRRYADSLTRAYMADAKSVDPALVSVSLQVSALASGRELFETFKRRFEQAQAPVERSRYLYAVGSFSDPELQDEALKYALEGPVRATELFSVLRGLPDTTASRDRAYRWLTDNFAEIVAKIPPDLVGRMPVLAGGCSEERLEAARAFFAEPKHNVDGTDTTLAKVADQVADCVGLRKREGEAVTAYLRRLSADSS